MGGGVVRTAAKLAGIGLRPSVSSAAGSARRASVPPAVTTAGVALAVGEKPNGVAQWQSWEMDDWEFADWKSEESLELASPTLRSPRGRLVFGSAPSIEEAKEATSDLKEALDRAYYSETQIGLDQGDHDVYVQSSAIAPVSGHVAQAFTLLQESPEAQFVVASLAADKNVWDAVMMNPKVLEFCSNYHANQIEGVGENILDAESEAEFDDPSIEKSFNDKLSEMVDDVKKNVMEAFNNVSNFVHGLFTPPEAHAGEGSVSENNSSFLEKAFGGSFIALAIAVIMVVLLKRA